MAEWIVPVSIPFHQGDAFGGRGGEHKGDDLAVPVGTPVLASAAGIVTKAELAGTYGNLIEIKHPNGDLTRYAHLSQFDVTPRSPVAQGQQIGLSGGQKGAAGAGNSTGPHLHTEHIVNGVRVDPAPFWSGTVADTPKQPSTPLDVFGQLGQTLNYLSQPTTWIRIGLFTGGIALIIIVLVKLLASSGAAKTIVETTKKVGAVAVTKNPAAAAAV
jgi:Membrane proteins related to metalloendopeptidases